MLAVSKMSVTAVAHIVHDRLALAPTLRSLDGLNINVVTETTTDPNTNRFPFVVNYANQQEFETALSRDPTVNEFALIDWAEEVGTYYLSHTEETVLISTIVTRVDGMLTRAWSSDGGWRIELLLPDRRALTRIWEYAQESEMQFNIMSVYQDQTISNNRYGLTPEQRVALQTALSQGYFDEPRESSLSDIAAELGISSTATSGRLRRGLKNLLSATIQDAPESK